MVYHVVDVYPRRHLSFYNTHFKEATVGYDHAALKLYHATIEERIVLLEVFRAEVVFLILVLYVGVLVSIILFLHRHFFFLFKSFLVTILIFTFFLVLFLVVFYYNWFIFFFALTIEALIRVKLRAS